MREIVLDTETTGLEPEKGDRMVEIGCLELINHVPTGKTLHLYMNPERDMPDGAFAVHGLSAEFLSKYPTFAEQVDQILDFLGDAMLIIHNARFDMGFINKELELVGRPRLSMDRALDTVALARRKYPGAQVSLDALCRRFEIDNSNRTLHGALIDADLLASVYLELIGGRQPDLMSGDGENAAQVGSGSTGSGQAGSGQSGSSLPGSGAAAAGGQAAGSERIYRAPRPHAATSDERASHEAFVAKLRNPIWTAGSAE